MRVEHEVTFYELSMVRRLYSFTLKERKKMQRKAQRIVGIEPVSLMIKKNRFGDDLDTWNVKTVLIGSNTDLPERQTLNRDDTFCYCI